MNWSTLTTFFAQPGRSTATELGIVVIIPLFIALALFGFGVSREKEGGPAWVKYLSLLPLAFGVIYGWQYFAFARDPIAVQGGLIGGKSLYMHLGAFLLPLAFALFVIGWGVVAKLMERGREDY